MDARAERNRLSIACTEHAGGDLKFVFEIVAPGVAADALQHDGWELPGLTVRLETTAEGPLVSRDADVISLHYHTRSSRAGAPIHFILRIVLRHDTGTRRVILTEHASH